MWLLCERVAVRSCAKLKVCVCDRVCDWLCGLCVVGCVCGGLVVLHWLVVCVVRMCLVWCGRVCVSCVLGLRAVR